MKKIEKITLKQNEILSDKELSVVANPTLTNCGSTYFFKDGKYYCTSHNQKCINPSKKEEDGSYKVGYCDTYTYEDTKKNMHVNCYCNINS